MFINILTNPSYSPREKLLMITAGICAIAIAIMLHEVAHGFIAMKQGDYTAKYSGRLTLNPVVHFDPIGMLMFLIVGIGWARPVPVDIRNFKNRKRGVFLVSIAGVVVNFLLAAVGFLLLVLLSDFIGQGLILGNVFAIFGYHFLIFTITINLSLMAFNLLPIYPLDGFRIVENFTKYDNKYVNFMRRNGQSIFMVLVVLGIFADNFGLPWLDLLGSYINWVYDAVLDLFVKVGGLLK